MKNKRLARADADDEDGPERLCIVSRTVQPPEGMIRFVVGPDGRLVPDLKANLPGRGAWVTAEAPMVKEAMRRKAFGRSLKLPVDVPDTLVADIDRLLERDALQALSFANKAGQAVSGFGKVEQALGKGQVIALLHAAEAAPDGVRKVDQALRRQGEATSARVLTINAFAAEDLGLALGGAHVIHAALNVGAASRGFLARWQRLSRFRTIGPGVDTTSGATPVAGAEG